MFVQGSSVFLHNLQIVLLVKVNYFLYITRGAQDDRGTLVDISWHDIYGIQSLLVQHTLSGAKTCNKNTQQVSPTTLAKFY